MRLPSFHLEEYASLLEELRARGWSLLPVTTMPDGASRHAYIRHDVDFHLDGIDSIARVEADMGVSATYYVLLTGPYNVLDAGNRRRIDELIGLGHEIGLHYDLTTYPTHEDEAAEHLDWECSVLERVTSSPVNTICMHQPSLAGDLFIDGQRRVHPHDPSWSDGLVYISDSCRGWRDDALLECFGDRPPERLLLNTHPELWLDGSITDRMRYLDDVVLAHLTAPMQAYVDGVVRDLWRTHPGGIRQDERERAGGGSAGRA